MGPAMIPRIADRDKLPSAIGLSETELETYVQKKGFRKFHGRQIFQWIYRKYADNFRLMTDVPEELRGHLNRHFPLSYYTPYTSQWSGDRDTVKYVFLTGEDTGIEVVVLTDKNSRTTFCLSSQIGCTVCCIYCATGKSRFIRNLEAGEIINQVLSLIKIHSMPDSILFMGMGEPLLNYDEVLKSVHLLNSMGFSTRKITVSTCGIVKGIYDLADSGVRPRLAVSLGSALEEKRKQVIPLAQNESLSRLREALGYYREKTGRRITLEYTLMDGINDTPADAASLSQFAKATGSHVNIIRYNPQGPLRKGSEPAALQWSNSLIAGRQDIIPPPPQKILAFKRILSKSGIRVTERYRRGNDINAACGQLVPVQLK